MATHITSYRRIFLICLLLLTFQYIGFGFGFLVAEPIYYDKGGRVHTLDKGDEKPPILVFFEGKFEFKGTDVTQEWITWMTKNERKNGQFFIERARNNSWSLIKGVGGKGEESNIYKVDIKHEKGENNYRIKYLNAEGKYFYSPTVSFVAKEDPAVSFYPKRVSSKITFSRSTSYQILDKKRTVLIRGEGLSVNCSDLSTGLYYLIIDGREEQFFKK
ncbi:MAG: hypothetical protein JJT94_04820 [Bernardetiaceae bacterium]|nr:hypothetical protein [Bernardetiaceae bacterium]